jgi:glycosyltransferase involved in cell wall biosynthesis
MRSGLVSIMMPAYNAAPYIGKAIESVLAQSYTNWELIIVNDGSTDNTAEVAARYTDPRIRLLHQSNAGEAVARNRALDESHGEYVAFLDADDLFLPDHLVTTVKHLLEHPEHAGVYTDGHYCDPQDVRMELLSSRRRGPFQGWIFEQLLVASDVFGPPVCVVIRTDRITSRGLRFDPLIVIGPDWDFFTHYAEGVKFGSVTRATCLYRVHQTNVTLRVDIQKRAAYLARCREKAIKLEQFWACSSATQVAVFYDLLVNLLQGHYSRQDAITAWPQFRQLPPAEQARLLRLMASKNMNGARESVYIERWLARARQLNPHDSRGALLYYLYRLSPKFCRTLLRFKQLRHADAKPASPFGKLV